MSKRLLNKSKPPALHGLVHCGGDGGLEREWNGFEPEWLYKYSHATKKNEPLLICPSTPYCFLLKDLAFFFSEVTDPVHLSPLPSGFLQALKHLGQLNGAVNFNIKRGSDWEKREVRISDYRVFVCLWARRDGSFIFFNSAHTQHLDPALELIHMSLGLCLQGGPFQDFIAARASACVCASVYKLWNFCWSSIFDY